MHESSNVSWQGFGIGQLLCGAVWHWHIIAQHLCMWHTKDRGRCSVYQFMSGLFGVFLFTATFHSKFKTKWMEIQLISLFNFDKKEFVIFGDQRLFRVAAYHSNPSIYHSAQNQIRWVQVHFILLQIFSFIFLHWTSFRDIYQMNHQFSDLSRKINKPKRRRCEPKLKPAIQLQSD